MQSHLFDAELLFWLQKNQIFFHDVFQNACNRNANNASKWKMTILDDIDYVKRTLAGDTAAFSVLVERYQSQVFSIVVRMVRHRQDAEDVAQEAFIKAFSSLSGFRGEAQFSTWLCRIAYTTAVSHIRKQRPDRAGIKIENEPDIENTDSGNQGEDRLRQLQQSLQDLPPEDAALISLYYREDKTMEEIAFVTGLSVANAKVRLHRIRKKLYQEIKNISNG